MPPNKTLFQQKRLHQLNAVKQLLNMSPKNQINLSNQSLLFPTLIEKNKKHNKRKEHNIMLKKSSW